MYAPAILVVHGCSRRFRVQMPLVHIDASGSFNKILQAISKSVNELTRRLNTGFHDFLLSTSSTSIIGPFSGLTE